MIRRSFDKYIFRWQVSSRLHWAEEVMFPHLREEQLVTRVAQ